MHLRTVLVGLCGAVTLAVAVLATSMNTSSETGGKGITTVGGLISGGRALSRQKRYIVFPRGSSLNLVYCLSFGGYIPFQTIFVFGITAGLSWPLPTEPEQVYLQRREAGRHPDREHRVNLFRSVRAFLAQSGLNGEDCVERTICETSHVREGKGTFTEEVIKVLFTLPSPRDAESQTSWDAARYNGTPCEISFPRCSSVLDLTLPTEKKQ